MFDLKEKLGGSDKKLCEFSFQSQVLQSKMCLFFFLFLQTKVLAPLVQNDSCAEFDARRLFPHSLINISSPGKTDQ